MFVNMTPHIIRLNDGTEFLPTGTIPRVSTVYGDFVDGICKMKVGEVVGLPPEQDGVYLIVSGMVASASKRKDLVSPATGHSECIRKDGQIYSVPGFVQE